MKSVEEMLKELEVATKEMLFVPNDLLPESFRDEVRGGRTLARLDELCEEIADTETAHQKPKAAKARNIEKLRKQFEQKAIYTTHRGGTDFVDMESGFDYSDNEADDLQLTKNMMAFVGGMVNRGMIDADDLLED